MEVTVCIRNLGVMDQSESLIHSPVCQQLVLPLRLSQHLLFPLPTIAKSHVVTTTAASLDHQRSSQVTLPPHLDPPAALTTSKGTPELSRVSCWPWPLTLPSNALTLSLAFESRCLYPIRLCYSQHSFAWLSLLEPLLGNFTSSKPSEAFLLSPRLFSCFLQCQGLCLGRGTSEPSPAHRDPLPPSAGPSSPAHSALYPLTTP